MDILRKAIILVANRHWFALRVSTPETVLTDMVKETLMGVNITYFENPDGSFDLENVVGLDPVSWDKWIELPVRSCDLGVQTPTCSIRIPTVAICAHYDKQPNAKPKLCLENVARRDGNRCQYSGKRLSRSQMSLDHVTPKHLGGKTLWTNLVLADKHINMKKGCQTNEEAGLRLLSRPKEPLASPVLARISCDHPSWRPFLMRHK